MMKRVLNVCPTRKVLQSWPEWAMKIHPPNLRFTKHSSQASGSFLYTPSCSGDEEGDADENVEEVNAGDAAEGDNSDAHGDVSAAHEEVPTVAQALGITKLKMRVKKLERRNKVRVLKLRRLQKDREVADAVKDVEEAKVDESAQDQGRQAESQAKIYKIDMDHANKPPSASHVAASYWTAASDVAAKSARSRPSVNDGQRRRPPVVISGQRRRSITVNAVGHRSTTADHGGDRWSTVVVNDDRRWRTTVDCRWTTVDHHRTTGQWWLVGSQCWTWAGFGSSLARVWIGSGPGLPRGMPRVSHVCTRVPTWHPRGC
nr:hypothetical protein [Tanacetum cinerariifolium]